MKGNLLKICIFLENHNLVFSNAGFAEGRTYRYWKPETRGIDFEGLLEDLGSAPAGAVVILHACAHNPTGCDPTKEQWEKIAEVIKVHIVLLFFTSSILLLIIYIFFFNFRLKTYSHSLTVLIKDLRQAISKRIVGLFVTLISLALNSSVHNRLLKTLAFMVSSVKNNH